MNETQFCKRCNKETPVIWNDYMVRFCSKCFWPHEHHFQPDAFVCRYCERGFDQTYPGQSVCEECEAERHRH